MPLHALLALTSLSENNIGLEVMNLRSVGSERGKFESITPLQLSDFWCHWSKIWFHLPWMTVWSSDGAGATLELRYLPSSHSFRSRYLQHFPHLKSQTLTCQTQLGKCGFIVISSVTYLVTTRSSDSTLSAKCPLLLYATSPKTGKKPKQELDTCWHSV